MNLINNLGQAEAQKAIETIKAEALKRGKAVVISVVDAQGDLLALLRLDGAPLPSIQISMNKAYTAARERRPTHLIGQAARDPQDGFDIAFYGDPRIVGWMGGLPVLVGQVVVGAVGVSGVAGDEDLELAKLGADAILSSLK